MLETAGQRNWHWENNLVAQVENWRKINAKDNQEEEKEEGQRSLKIIIFWRSIQTYFKPRSLNTQTFWIRQLDDNSWTEG